MKQQTFEAQSREHWDRLDRVLSDSKAESIDILPQLYRQVCHDLALAKQRRYTPGLIDFLNRLVMRGHHRLYQKAGRYQYHWINFIVAGFPQAVRRNAIFVYLSLCLFVLPGIVVGVLCFLDEEIVYSAMSYPQVQAMESLYDPEGDKIGRERQSDTDLMMFGFYIKNNIGIGFRTFAGGVFFCLGSIFFLVYNGIVIGAVAGHLTQLGFAHTFYPFVIGHGSFELTAIVFSGAAGLKLGYSLINPGQHPRVQALKIAAKEAVRIMAGAALMLVVAAFLEAFWSSSTTYPEAVKYGVGAVLWLAVLLYFLFSGRRPSHGSG
jgi:uncharacterized membrane protein SpoIIM required for sporulation